MITFLFLVIYLWLLLHKPTKTILISVIWYPSMTLYNVLNPGFIISVSLIVLFVRDWNKIKKKNQFPFWIPFAFCASSYVISYFIWHAGPSAIYQSLFIYILPIAFWIYYKDNIHTRHFFMKHLVTYLFILTLVGVIEAIFHINPFFDLAKAMNPEIPDKGFNIRFGLKQAQSMTIWCECFGTVCGMAAAVIPFYLKKWNLRIDLKMQLLLGLLLFSVICSGSRTAIAASAICLVGTFLHFNVKSMLLLLVPIMLLPFIFPDMFDEIYGSIVHQSDYGGSSSDMRENQWLVSLYYASQNLLFGTGLGKTFTIGYESGLLGAESILFYTIIDRGIWGLITIGFLFVYIVVYLVMHKNYCLCFIVLGFLANKLITLTAGLDETYPLLWLIPLLKEQLKEQKYEAK